MDEAIEVQPNWQGEESAIYGISKIDFDRLRKEFERSPKKNTTVQNLRQAVEQRLQRLLLQNPLRTDFQQHYEQIVSEYNREKDRVTIEKTFESLFKLVQELDDEEHRAVREGLDEESLAIFDLLRKPDLNAAEIKRIKTVAVQLLGLLKSRIRDIDHWRDRESTRDALRVLIRDYLWDESTGLSVASFDEEEVDIRAADVFRHIYRAYPKLPSPFYSSTVA
ncbi:MAG: type I restriction enzyme endonuclease domain-containing protein [Pseudomonadota bacterium]